MNKVNLILHAHLPYVRHLEYPKFLEENWLFESLNETYIPLLRMFEKLDMEGLGYHVSICFSPTLVTMLTDGPLQERFVDYMNGRIELGEKEAERTLHEDRECHGMALRYLEEARTNLEMFERCGRNILIGYRNLSDRNRVELLTTAATHAYLPIYKNHPTAIKAQVVTGLRTYERVFGQSSKGFWLPECGYYPGLDKVLYDNGVMWCQLASHSVISARDKSIYGGYKPVRLPSGLAGFPRDWSLTSLVWSSVSGYPCDGDNRDFYRDIGYYLPLDYVRPYIHEPEVRVFTGYKYHAITGSTENKRFYDYDKAMEKTALHVENYLYSIKRKGLALETSGISDPIFNLCFDAELFGHRWYEGIRFLELFLRRGAECDDIAFTTPMLSILDGNEYDSLYVNESSWGTGGYSDTWLDASNSWIYRHIMKALDRMEELTHRFPEQGSLKGRFLNQASREVLLAMASDWPCIMHDRTSVSYAEKRLRNHLGSFNVVYSSMCQNTVNTEWLINAERSSQIFPDMDYTLFDPDKL